MEVDQLAVMEMVHDVNLLPDQGLLHGVTNGDELGSKDMLGLEFSASVNNSKGSSSDLLQHLIVIIDTVLSLDLHRLRNVLGVDIKNKLIIVTNFTLLTTDLLSSFRIN